MHVNARWLSTLPVVLAVGMSLLLPSCGDSARPSLSNATGCPNVEAGDPMEPFVGKFAQWDTDHDRCLRTNEFEALFGPHFDLLLAASNEGATAPAERGSLDAARLQAYFHRLEASGVQVVVDPDGDGRTTAEEWATVARSLVPFMDGNADGCVSCPELFEAHALFWGGG